MYWRSPNYFGAHRVRQRPVYLSMAVVAFAGGLQEVCNRWWRWRRTHKRSAHRWCSKALRQHSSFFLTNLGFGSIAVAVYKSSTQIHLFRDAQRASQRCERSCRNTIFTLTIHHFSTRILQTYYFPCPWLLILVVLEDFHFTWRSPMLRNPLRLLRLVGYTLALEDQKQLVAQAPRA